MTIVVGLLMGVAYVLPPGPVTVETIRRSMLGGRRAALGVQLGAVLGDMVYAALVLAGADRLLLHGPVRFGLGVLGAALLVYLGLSAVRGGGQVLAPATGRSTEPPAAPSALRWQHPGAGFALALANPYALVFWLSIGGTTDRSAALLAGFFLGSLLASVLTALAAGQLRRERTPRFARWLWSGCGLILMLLGCNLGYTTLVTWWPI